MLQNKVLEYNLYLAGLVFAAVSVLGIALVLFTPFEFSYIMPQCSFKSITGLYCPGCGGSRAVAAFVQGHWIKSNNILQCLLQSLQVKHSGTNVFVI